MWVEANLAHRSNNFVYPRVCVCGWWCNTASEQECLNKHTNVLIICRGWCWRLVCWPSGPGWVDSDSREAARRGDSEAAAVRGAPTGNHSHAVFFFTFLLFTSEGFSSSLQLLSHQTFRPRKQLQNSRLSWIFWKFLLSHHQLRQKTLLSSRCVKTNYIVTSGWWRFFFYLEFQ